MKMIRFYHSKFYFLNGKFLTFGVFLQCCNNVVTTLNKLNFSMLVQRCVNGGTLISPQCSHKIQAMLSQHCGNIENYVMFNVVTML